MSYFLAATKDAELKIASLTSSERTHWAKVRKEHFAEGSNKDSLDTINEALFVVCLYFLQIG